MKNIDKVILLAGLVGDPITKKYPAESKIINDSGVKNVIDLCAEEEVDEMMDANHCDFTWYCSGDCEFAALADIVASQSGCLLPDAPNYNASALVACTTECVNGQTGSNCCCEN